ncbi:helix-turn-helix domain-containing protein [Schlegelella sp. S2-27]|uniref:Helix-turn-helix domain-containing protein n=1 Tax=Caldimonas mangrovi TaxID=2944811 RepID=A0ABT0YLH5_9BURK|nr:helix-turn-helix domain-containing protein [Caldimonas mangrovi]MCM5679586.1 helix-turn-helix domain-containing protein [Caldimonas mangrovi]
MSRAAHPPPAARLPPLQVSILVLPETAPMAVYGLYEVLASVGRAWPQLTGEAVQVRGIEPRIVARGARPFRSLVGLPIHPQASVATAPLADVVIVCDVELPLPARPGHRWSRELRWLRSQHAAGATVCSTCSGSLVLAEAGMLDGLEAASHWSAAQVFRDRYPAVRFVANRILCDSSRDGRLVTTGGASSWHDLALYLIGRYCGPAEAVRAAKIFLIGDRRQGQLPFAAMARPRQHEDAVIAECQAWIADHYPQPNPVTRMVQRSGLPERTFKRRFTQATGYAPVEYVQTLRIEEAKQLLESTGDAVEAIAAVVGYEDPAFFRRLFKRLAGVTPAQYRLRFQSIRTLHAPATSPP